MLIDVNDITLFKLGHDFVSFCCLFSLIFAFDISSSAIMFLRINVRPEDL